jgi:hypothetical protein
VSHFRRMVFRLEKHGLPALSLDEKKKLKVSIS